MTQVAVEIVFVEKTSELIPTAGVGNGFAKSVATGFGDFLAQRAQRYVAVCPTAEQRKLVRT